VAVAKAKIVVKMTAKRIKKFLNYKNMKYDVDLNIIIIYNKFVC
jgi:hypothetical protein